MQQLALEQRRLLGARAPWHVGDVAWGLRQHEGREPEWRIRLWAEDGRVVAWSWLKQDGRDRLELDVHPEHEHLLEEILSEPDARVAFAFEDDVERRAALARHGFTEPQPSYAQVRATWPYRAILDCAVREPAGGFAAYCLCWLDVENRVGEFEPVGVREEFRRQGLGAAVCTFALRRLYEEGGRQAIVYCVTEAACALYESVGFRRHATLRGFVRGGRL
jgi:ribosomal protein S18 acetylase RimI-like enzyme